jgi:hypothetical protein
MHQQHVVAMDTVVSHEESTRKNRRLQIAEYARRRQDENGSPEYNCETVGAAIIRTFDGPLDKLRAVGPDKRSELANDRAGRCVLTEDQPSDCNDDYQDGNKRRDAIEGNRRSARKRIASNVILDRVFDDLRAVKHLLRSIDAASAPFDVEGDYLAFVIWLRDKASAV